MNSTTDFSPNLFTPESLPTEKLRKIRIVVMVIVGVVAGLFTIISCNSGQPVKEELQTGLATETIQKKPDPHCLGRNDTIFPNKDYLNMYQLGTASLILASVLVVGKRC